MQTRGEKIGCMELDGRMGLCRGVGRANAGRRGGPGPEARRYDFRRWLTSSRRWLRAVFLKLACSLKISCY